MAQLNSIKFYRTKDSGWRPILHSKRHNEDPKFILSLERKKARIISGIREKQINTTHREQGKMQGSKVKYFNKSFHQPHEDKSK